MITADLLGGSGLAANTVRDALLGLVTARHTQSSSVVLVKDGSAIGIGAGQQNQVDCVRLPGGKARAWWLRRQPHIRDLPQPVGMRRQEHLNWQIRMAEGELTRTQRDEFAVPFPGVDRDLDGQVRAEWIERLDQVTVVSDGFFPFRDNIDHAAAVGVRYIRRHRNDQHQLGVADHPIHRAATADSHRRGSNWGADCCGAVATR